MGKWEGLKTRGSSWKRLKVRVSFRSLSFLFDAYEFLLLPITGKRLLHLFSFTFDIKATTGKEKKKTIMEEFKSPFRYWHLLTSLWFLHFHSLFQSPSIQFEDQHPFPSKFKAESNTFLNFIATELNLSGWPAPINAFIFA